MHMHKYVCYVREAKQLACTVNKVYLLWSTTEKINFTCGYYRVCTTGSFILKCENKKLWGVERLIILLIFLWMHVQEGWAYVFHHLVFISSMSQNLPSIYFHTLQYETPCMYTCRSRTQYTYVQLYWYTYFYVCKLEALNEKFTHARIRPGPCHMILMWCCCSKGRSHRIPNQALNLYMRVCGRLRRNI